VEYETTIRQLEGEVETLKVTCAHCYGDDRCLMEPCPTHVQIERLRAENEALRTAIEGMRALIRRNVQRRGMSEASRAELLAVASDEERAQ
jgi:hypothetical protein